MFYRTQIWSVVPYFCLYIAFLFWVGKHYWDLFKLHNPQLKFNYRITDIWAATFGCTPSFLLLKFAIEKYDTSLLLVFMAVLFGQVVGLMIGRVHIEIPPHRGAKNAWESAVSICHGCDGWDSYAVFVFTGVHSLRIILWRNSIP